LIVSSTLFGSLVYYKINKSKSNEINISEIFLKKASKSLNLDEIGNLLEHLLKENLHVKSFSYLIIQRDSKLKYSYKFNSDAQVINILTNQFWSYYKDPNKIILLAELKYLRTVSIETNNLWKYKRFITLIEKMVENSWHIIVPISLSNNMKCLLFLGENSKNYMYSASEVSNIKNLTEVVRITIERGLLYKQTEDFNLSLQQKVSEQTKELQQKVQQLEEARRKEADMIDIMGHELRTPMSIVKLNTDLLHNFTDNVIRKKEDFIKYVTRIRNAVETEIVLINTLLSTAKLEGDKIDLNPTKVDIVEQIKMAMHSQETRAKRKGIQLITKFDPTAQNVYADHARAVEIVSNLIDNAVKYTQKGYVKVTTEDEGDFIRVSVIDTGMGISKKDVDRLGTKFFRTSNYTQSEFSDDIDIVRPGGSGLGLYVVFNLVEKMGGEIHVESQLGQGSNFTFALPKYRGQKPVSDQEYTKDMFERLGLKKKDDIKDNLQQ
jgi:signal transduction histidine kinase